MNWAWSCCCCCWYACWYACIEGWSFDRSRRLKIDGKIPFTFWKSLSFYLPHFGIETLSVWLCILRCVARNGINVDPVGETAVAFRLKTPSKYRYNWYYKMKMLLTSPGTLECNWFLIWLTNFLAWWAARLKCFSKIQNYFWKFDAKSIPNASCTWSSGNCARSL